MILTKAILHTTDSYIKRLKAVGIETVSDLISHYPRALENRLDAQDSFSLVNIKEKNTIIATIESMTTDRTRNGKTLAKMVLSDAHGFHAEAVWFSRPYFFANFHLGDRVKIFGKPKYEYGRLSFPSPEIDFADKQWPKFVPVYSDANYIWGNWFREKMPYVREYMDTIPDVLPESFRTSMGFVSMGDNLRKIHFPASEQEFEEARKELAYRELFVIQYAGITRKGEKRRASEGRSPVIPLNPERVKEIIAKLPFELTEKQKIVLFQALRDMEAPYSMARLLQGDVGTGKTAVAFIAALHAIFETGGVGEWIQVAMMAPTEILARQHFESYEKTFASFGIRSDLLVGWLNKKQKEEVKMRLKTGETQIVFGTHALIVENVVFRKLGFVVVDEQHRFWVEQRTALESYYSLSGGIYPHVLNMTATPIPRTLALTLYGDQDLSVLNQYPAGRKPILTKVIRENERAAAYGAVELELRAGRQVYWISPLVEESESLDVANAVSMTETLQEVFPNFRVGLIHGRMKSKEKDVIMQAFYNHEIDVLSSTSVVEVGVNNPNATVMAIEASERFGLSQLHQFRGRVGRGADQSFCFLFTTKEYTGDRLRAMEKTGDGFELSEIDLELRGPGEVYGVRQSGLPDFKIADLRDIDLVSTIRSDIEEWEKEVLKNWQII